MMLIGGRSVTRTKDHSRISRIRGYTIELRVAVEVIRLTL